MQTKSLIGHRLGNYKIDSLIDQGGMGSVYEGVHMLLGRRVAIKQLNPILEQKEGVKETSMTLTRATSLTWIECSGVNTSMEISLNGTLAM